MSGNIRALHVVAGLDPAHGGPTYSVPRLCEALASAGTSTTLFSVATADGKSTDSFTYGYRDRRFVWDFARVPVLRGLRVSVGFSRAVYEDARDADVVHDHGIWLWPNVVAGRAATRLEKPFILSTRGMLAPAALAFSAIRKRIFWTLAQAAPVRSASCLHATSEQEYSEIRDFGLVNPVAVIRNGIDVPEISAVAHEQREPTVLALGRVHPKKGLDRLVSGWAKVGPAFPKWRLRIVGPAEAGYDEELRAIARRQGLDGVSVEGPVYGAAKIAALGSAALFVLPSLNENFGLVVAEALAAGMPVISTKGTPWSGLDSHGCGWWIDQGVEPLAAALGRAMAMPVGALSEMGAKGRAWMDREFSWESVAEDMQRVYRWVAEGTEPPPFVRFN